MEFGNDTTEAIHHLRRQLDTIEAISLRVSDVRIPPESGSDLDVLVSRVGAAPVHLGRGIQSYLTTSLHCLMHLRAILASDRDDPPIAVLQSLLRPVLMASGRIVFILGPNDRDTQLERALTVLRQEGDSLTRAVNAFTGFQHLSGYRPSPNFISEIKADATAVRARAVARGEGQILDEMARDIATEVAAASTDSDLEPEVLRESVVHDWHTLSGGAHGYVWPESAPGDFVTSLGTVVPVAQWAIDLAARRTQV